MFSREDYLESNERLGKETLNHQPQLEMLHQAAVKSDLLTKDDGWDFYLTLIQSWIEKTELQKNQFKELSLSADIVNEDEQRRIKNYYLQCSERLVVLQEIITIPKQIVEQHEKIALNLKEIPDVT